MPRSYTVDASVAIKLFVPEVYSDLARTFFATMTKTQAALYVPDIFYLECANILWKYTWRFGYDLLSARENLRDLSRLALTPFSSDLLFQQAFDLANRHRVSTYDAAYLAVARVTETDLITADAHLARKLKSTFRSIRRIDELAL